MSLAAVQTEGFAYGGEAFGRLPDGRVCFFRGGVPGETAELELTCVKRSFARGVLRNVPVPSPSRIIPKCPLAFRPGTALCCPGCSFQQVEHSVELRWKQRQLEDFLLRGKLAGAEVFDPPEPSPSRFGWRNRLKLSRAGGETGFFAEDNVSIVPVEHCPLAVAALDSSSITINVRPWAKCADYWAVYSGVQQAVKEAFEKNGIQIPFPQMDVHVKNS